MSLEHILKLSTHCIWAKSFKVNSGESIYYFKGVRLFFYLIPFLMENFVSRQVYEDQRTNGPVNAHLRSGIYSILSYKSLCIALGHGQTT